MIDVAQHYKFAVFAFPEARASLTGFITLQRGLAASTALPANALETWKASLGTFHIEELSNTSLFLWALRKSANPSILDEENRSLTRDVHRFWIGLLLAVPTLSHGRVTSLTGANVDGTARVRSLTWYNRTWRTAGTPQGPVSASHFKLAAELAGALRAHSEQPSHRMVRALRAFRQACEAVELDIRLHQFVRCLEAFAVPELRGSAISLATRLRTLCVGPSQRVLKELYDIGSGIEHLSGPFDRMPRRPRHGRRARLALRCVQAEGMARFLLRYYFQTPALWPHFDSKANAIAFWHLSKAQRSALWPTRVKFAAFASQFDVGLYRKESTE